MNLKLLKTFFLKQAVLIFLIVVCFMPRVCLGDVGKFKVNILPAGAVEIQINGVSFILESYYSYPADKIKYNRFAKKFADQDAAGAVSIRKIDSDSFAVDADCGYYTISRTIAVKPDKVEITETLKNNKDIPVGVIINHELTSALDLTDNLLGGYRDQAYSQSAALPMVYVKTDQAVIGVLAEDSISRLQFFSNLANKNMIKWGLNNFALDSGKQYTLKWTIYPLNKDDDYFTLINKIRNDWNTNFTIAGPFDFFDVLYNRELLKNTEKLKAYFKRKKIGILALIPWLDYDNFNYLTGKSMDRAEYLRVMKDAYLSVKKADPSIRVIGCMQSDLINLPDNISEQLYKILPDNKKESGFYKTSSAEKDILDQARLKGRDSLLVLEDGNYMFEVFYPMVNPVSGEPPKKTHPLLAAAVYAAPGNSQFDYWLNQAKFILEDVGLDGIYIDQFSLAFNPSIRYSYDRWDGVTVDINKATGKITKTYTDGSYAGIEARKKLIDYVLSKNKTMVANTYAAVSQTQSSPIYRFREGGEWAFNPLKYSKGQMPPMYGYLTTGNLGSPIILGGRPWRLGKEGIENYAKVIYKSMIVYLRHGLVYYYFNTDIPENGQGSGEHGPVNHMFPITPVKIGPGFIEGKERIISAVSGDFDWHLKRAPAVLLFNLQGKEIKNNCKIIKEPLGWKIKLKLNDWEEIAIVE